MPFVYYIPEQDTEAMQKPMDAERLLRCLGASGKLAGFPCAAYMVEQVREDPERIRLITKRLYRETARKFRISPSSVERDLRTLIRSCWEQPDRSFLEHVAEVNLKSEERKSVPRFLNLRTYNNKKILL